MTTTPIADFLTDIVAVNLDITGILYDFENFDAPDLAALTAIVDRVKALNEAIATTGFDDPAAMPPAVRYEDDPMAFLTECAAFLSALMPKFVRLALRSTAESARGLIHTVAAHEALPADSVLDLLRLQLVEAKAILARNGFMPPASDWNIDPLAHLAAWVAFIEKVEPFINMAPAGHTMLRAASEQKH